VLCKSRLVVRVNASIGPMALEALWIRDRGFSSYAGKTCLPCDIQHFFSMSVGSRPSPVGVATAMA
jgi:hypothetical protein